jgi:hypothetical protein
MPTCCVVMAAGALNTALTPNHLFGSQTASSRTCRPHNAWTTRVGIMYSYSDASGARRVRNFDASGQDLTPRSK